MTLRLLDIIAAQKRLRGHLAPTPLLSSSWLSAASGADVHLKLESVHPTRSFKIRGAVNAVLCLRERQPGAAALVTASAGNHGSALAFAAQRFGLRAVVFTPATAPRAKRDAIRRLGADLRDDAPDYDAAEEAARAYSRETGVPYISPYNHPDVIAGAGTIALELLAELRDLDSVVIPLGGGGLASGVALALAAASPSTTRVGVEVAASTPFATGIARGAITAIEVGASLADGLVGNLEPGAMTFALVQQHVSRLVAVDEDVLARAIDGLAREERLIAEGAGAVATAAVLTGVVRPRSRVVVLVTGSNRD